MVYVTASSTDEARRLATALVQQKLVACVNILPGVESVYEWQGKLGSSQEVMLMIKVRVVSVQWFFGCKFCSFDILLLGDSVACCCCS